VKKFILLAALLILPVLSSADDYTFFKENQDSIVVVTAYNKKGEPLTEGTGFIASSDGLVITNYHVIGIAKRVKVWQGSRALDVEGVMYGDKENDFVILKAKGKGLPSVKFGHAYKIKSGEKVYIISSSKNAGHTLSKGVFRKMRQASRGSKVVEITAPVSHGSSGSPIFNKDGEVIGITTSLLKRAESLILAVPADIITEKLDMRAPVTSIENIIKNYQNSAEYWFYLGYYLSEVNLHKDAVNVFDEALSLKPDFADARYYRGLAYEKLGRDKEALKDYREAARLQPDFADAYFSLGIVCGRLGRYKEAAEALKQAVRLEPDFTDAHYNLGVAYLLLHDKGAAIEKYNALKPLNSKLADKLLSLINKSG
jgi:hypothetical protein